ncbi:MAG: hypothetical protein PQJ59_05700 [Spirochaetales bacterium]|nr:hypothetical protein [Spirochaetales bacterium]
MMNLILVKRFFPVLLFFLIPTLLSGETFSLELDVEYGFSSILSHEIQSGTDDDKGDVFDYLSSGNQDKLFPFARYQIDVEVLDTHHIVFLYQPLLLETEALIEEDFRYDEVDFTTADGTVELIYSFDFWRFSYLYDLIEGPGFFLSPGVSLQIRNVSISFISTDGSKSSLSNGVGPVPVLKLRTGYEWEEGFFLLFDGDAFYASNKFINGAGYSFTGYIYDLAFKAGYEARGDFSPHVGVRFLGGGADGTTDEGEYTYNDLHTFSVTVGMTWRI